jgi:hypothetical protein
MNMETTRKSGLILIGAFVALGFVVIPATADESKDIIAVRLDLTPADGGKGVEEGRPQLTKSGFEIGAIPLYKKKLSAKQGQTLRIELPYAATGYAWDYTGKKEGNVALTGSPHGKVQEIPPAAADATKDQPQGEKRTPDRPRYGSGTQSNPIGDGTDARERRALAGRPQLQVFEFQAKERGASTLVFRLTAVSDPLPAKFCSITVNVD